jgi:hypothetical protein
MDTCPWKCSNIFSGEPFEVIVTNEFLYFKSTLVAGVGIEAAHGAFRH